MSKKDDFKVFEKFVDEKSDFESVKSKITPKELGSVKPAKSLNKRKFVLLTTLASVLVVAIILSVIFIPFGKNPDQTANTSVNIGDNSVISANVGGNSATNPNEHNDNSKISGHTGVQISTQDPTSVETPISVEDPTSVVAPTSVDSPSGGGGTVVPMMFPSGEGEYDVVTLSDKAYKTLNAYETYTGGDVQVLLSLELFEGEYEGKDEFIRLCELSAEDDETYREQVDSFVGGIMEEEKEWLEGLGLTVTENDDTSFVVSGSCSALMDIYTAKYHYYISMGDERTAPEVDIEALRGWYVAEEIVCRKGTKKDGYFENDFKLPFYFEVKDDAIIDDRSDRIVPKTFLSLRISEKYNSIDLQNLINYKAKSYLVLTEEGSNSFTLGLYINSYGTYATVLASNYTFKVKKVDASEIVFPETEGDELLPQVEAEDLYGKYRVPEVIFANHSTYVSVKEGGLLTNELEFMIDRSFTIEEEPVDRSRENFYGFSEYISIYGGEEMQDLMHSAYRKFVAYNESGHKYVFIYVSTQGVFVSDTRLGSAAIYPSSVYKAEYLGTPEDFPEAEVKTGKKGEYKTKWSFAADGSPYLRLVTSYQDYLEALSSDTTFAGNISITDAEYDEEFFEEWAVFAIIYTYPDSGYSVKDVNVNAKGNALNFMIDDDYAGGGFSAIVNQFLCVAVDRTLLDGVEKIKVAFRTETPKGPGEWNNAYIAGINDHAYTSDNT